MPNNMLNHHALFCQLLVELFLFSSQFAAFRFLEWYPRVFVQIKQSLITAVRQTLDFSRQIRFAMFIKRKIVPCAFGKSRVNNPLGLFASPHLRFYRVPLFLAGIISLLFFFGRSTGDSATSMTTTSNSAAKSGRRFAGKANSFELIKMSSTLVMMRDTADSLIPQLVPMWNIVRYSRQYSKVNRIWSSGKSFGGLPLIRKRLVDFSLTSSHIFSKVRRSTPQYRLKLAAESFFSFS